MTLSGLTPLNSSLHIKSKANMFMLIIRPFGGRQSAVNSVMPFCELLQQKCVKRVACIVVPNF